MPGVPLCRFGVVGDIHGEDAHLAAALAFLRTHPLDAILSVGDITDGHGDVQRCCDLLLDASVTAVRGNHDRWFLDEVRRDLAQATQPRALNARARAFLAALPVTRDLPTEDGPLLLCHGLGAHDLLDLGPDEDGGHPELAEIIERGYRYLVNGHSHAAIVRTFGPLVWINPGTLHREDKPGFLQVDLALRTVTLYRFRSGLQIEERRVYDLPARPSERQNGR